MQLASRGISLGGEAGGRVTSPRAPYRGGQQRGRGPQSAGELPAACSLLACWPVPSLEAAMSAAAAALGAGDPLPAATRWGEGVLLAVPGPTLLLCYLDTAGAAAASLAGWLAGWGADGSERRFLGDAAAVERARALSAIAGVGAADQHADPAVVQSVVAAARSGAAFQENPYSDGVGDHLATAQQQGLPPPPQQQHTPEG